jgi:aminobenzoyl-glutamate transport protein
MESQTSQHTYAMRFLDRVERIGNKLPNPVMMFIWLAFIVVVASVLASWAGLSATNPATGALVEAKSLLSAENLQKFFVDMPKTLTNFPPLGTVLVVMMGIGLAEKSGFIAAALAAMVRSVARFLLTPAVVFAGVMSSMAVDAGYVVLIPLAAALFAAAGRHPIAGLAAAFAGVSGGYSANLFVTSLDPLLGGITTSAAQIIDPGYTVAPTANYYMMIALVPLLTLIGWWITARLVEPRLGAWQAPDQSSQTPFNDDTQNQRLNEGQRRGLRQAGLVFVATIIVCLLLTFGDQAALRDAKSGALDPFFNGLVAITGISFLLMGIVYGKAAGTLKTQQDAITMVVDSMKEMGLYIVLAFTAAHFIALFSWSNLGLLLAINGAEGLKTIGLSGVSLMISMIFITAFLNLFIGSASAKWALIAPIFVPLLMLVGLSPEITQAAYRLGDSSTNIITPMMVYFPLVLVAAQRYVPSFGVGSLIACMLPYSIAILLGSCVLLALWVGFEIPVGPNAPVYLESVAQAK